MAVVKRYPARIVCLRNLIPEVYTLELESLSTPFRYLPGQFLHLAIQADYDGIGQWPESRCFSMQSSPDNKNITITYAVKGLFTREMEKILRKGSLVWIKLPYGNLFSQSYSKINTVFIAGGTGITPFLSLFNDSSFFDFQNPRIYLGFRTREHNIFRQEIEGIQNPSHVVKYYFEDCEGRIDVDEILHENRVPSDYFVSGPPAMIDSFRNKLLLYGISEAHIFTDNWG